LLATGGQRIYHDLCLAKPDNDLKMLGLRNPVDVVSAAFSSDVGVDNEALQHDQVAQRLAAKASELIDKLTSGF
jgi:hypothetical protein